MNNQAKWGSVPNVKCNNLQNVLNVKVNLYAMYFDDYFVRLVFLNEIGTLSTPHSHPFNICKDAFTPILCLFPCYFSVIQSNGMILVMSLLMSSNQFADE